MFLHVDAADQAGLCAASVAGRHRWVPSTSAAVVDRRGRRRAEMGRGLAEPCRAYTASSELRGLRARSARRRPRRLSRGRTAGRSTTSRASTPCSMRSHPPGYGPAGADVHAARPRGRPTREVTAAGVSSPPHSFARWGDLVGALVTHLRERVGDDELAAGRSRSGTSPTSPCSWTGTQEEYWTLSRRRGAFRPCRIPGPAGRRPCDGSDPLGDSVSGPSARVGRALRLRLDACLRQPATRSAPTACCARPSRRPAAVDRVGTIADTLRGRERQRALGGVRRPGCRG